MTEQTAGQRRTAAARATRRRQAEEKKAEELRARGWMCTPPVSSPNAKRPGC